MRIVLSVTRHDASQFIDLVAVMAKIGGLERQTITIVATPSQVSLAEEKLQILKPLCDEISLMRSLFEPEKDVWPQNPNALFNFVASNLHANGNKLPWFWMEPDCLPIRKGWIDKMDVLYQKNAPKFMGYVVPTPKRFANGDPAPSEPGDEMMMGCAVYPPDMLTLLARDDGIALFRDLRLDGIDVGWDLHLRWKFKKLGWLHTPMIGDFWHTQNYRIENGVLTCDLQPTEKPYAKKRLTTVTDENWLVHGCKDRSLASLILSGELPVDESLKPLMQPSDLVQALKITRIASEGVPLSPSFIESIHTANERIAALEKRVKALEERLMPTTCGESVTTTLLSTPVNIVNFRASGEIGPSGKEGAIMQCECLAGEHGPIDQSVGSEIVDPDVLLKWIKTKKRRINDMMATTKESKEKCEQALATVGYVIGKAGWLQKSNGKAS